MVGILSFFSSSFFSFSFIVFFLRRLFPSFVVFVSILHKFVQLYISTHKAPPTCSL